MGLILLGDAWDDSHACFIIGIQLLATMHSVGLGSANDSSLSWGSIGKFPSVVTGNPRCSAYLGPFWPVFKWVGIIWPVLREHMWINVCGNMLLGLSRLVCPASQWVVVIWPRWGGFSWLLPPTLLLLCKIRKGVDYCLGLEMAELLFMVVPSYPFIGLTILVACLCLFCCSCWSELPGTSQNCGISRPYTEIQE